MRDELFGFPTSGTVPNMFPKPICKMLKDKLPVPSLISKACVFSACLSCDSQCGMVVQVLDKILGCLETSTTNLTGLL